MAPCRKPVIRRWAARNLVWWRGLQRCAATSLLVGDVETDVGTGA